MQPVEENISLRSPLLEPATARNNDIQEIAEILDEDMEENLRSIGNPNPEQRQFTPSNYVESVGIDQGLGFFRTQNAWEGSEHDFLLTYYENQQSIIIDENRKVYIVPNQQEDATWPYETNAVHESMNAIAPEYGIPTSEISSEAVKSYNGWDKAEDLHLSDQVMETLSEFAENGEQQYIQNFVSSAYQKAAYPERAMDRLNGSNVEQVNGDGYAFTWQYNTEEETVQVLRLDELGNIYNSK